jgi:hypothetical protein
MSSYLWCGVDGELQLGLLAVVHTQPLHQQGCETRPSATAKRVEDEEALQTGALVSQLADPVQHQVHDLLADGVVAASVVVGCVFFARDELFRMEELSVLPRSYLVCNMIENLPCNFFQRSTSKFKMKSKCFQTISQQIISVRWDKPSIFLPSQCGDMRSIQAIHYPGHSVLIL